MQERLSWPHKYHQVLEDYHVLGRGSAVESVGPHTLAEQARRAQLGALEPKLHVLEKGTMSVRDSFQAAQNFCELVESASGT